jgi:hypothetical protein
MTRIERLKRTVDDWLAEARGKLSDGRFAASDLDALCAAVHDDQRVKKLQRILYLHASGPSIRSAVIGGAFHEPIAGFITEIDPMAPEMPYKSVHEAIIDGWRVIHFPQQLAPYNDREIDAIGYEFILEKMEVYDA